MEIKDCPSQYISIDGAGKLLHQTKPVLETEQIREIFSGLHFAENGALVTSFNEEACIIEYTDEPLIVKKFFIDANGEFRLSLDHDIIYTAQKECFSVDEWDRYHGLTTDPEALPFVLSPDAQNDFFNAVESFSDESYTLQDKEYPTPEYWADEIQVEDEDYWTNIYQTEEPRWDLGQPAPGLIEIYPKLKLPVSRVAVIGGGGGHDAAFFAERGHHVTLIDISAEAIAKAQKQYSKFSNLQYLQADVFDLPQELNHKFDLVFEHTCYCAINPTLRNELIKVWCSLLHETGQIFGVFFTMEKRKGPPFGGSEWELKHRLKNNFKPLIWQRVKTSVHNRWGKELVILAEKKH